MTQNDRETRWSELTRAGWRPSREQAWDQWSGRYWPVNAVRPDSGRELTARSDTPDKALKDPAALAGAE